MFRYAEGLLCYAEAAAELGLYNDGVAEKTLKPLRQRAGVAYVTPAADPHSLSKACRRQCRRYVGKDAQSYLCKVFVWMT